MEGWKKGAVLGGVWGLLSIPLFVILVPASISTPPMTTIIVSFPAWLVYLKLDLNPSLINGLLSILIGALIGSIIGFTIEKYKTWRLAQ